MQILCRRSVKENGQNQKLQNNSCRLATQNSPYSSRPNLHQRILRQVRAKPILASWTHLRVSPQSKAGRGTSVNQRGQAMRHQIRWAHRLWKRLSGAWPASRVTKGATGTHRVTTLTIAKVLWILYSSSRRGNWQGAQYPGRDRHSDSAKGRWVSGIVLYSHNWWEKARFKNKLCHTLIIMQRTLIRLLG